MKYSFLCLISGFSTWRKVRTKNISKKILAKTEFCFFFFEGHHQDFIQMTHILIIHGLVGWEP